MGEELRTGDAHIELSCELDAATYVLFVHRTTASDIPPFDLQAFDSRLCSRVVPWR